MKSRTWYPSIFACAVYSNAPLLHIAFLPGGKFPDQQTAYRRIEVTFPPVEALETYLGMGLNILVIKGLEMFQKIGVGYIRYFHFGAEGSPPENTFDFGSKYQMGLRFSFTKVNN